VEVATFTSSGSTSQWRRQQLQEHEQKHEQWGQAAAAEIEELPPFCECGSNHQQSTKSQGCRQQQQQQKQEREQEQ
jgi:hypothetical protein